MSREGILETPEGWAVVWLGCLPGWRVSQTGAFLPGREDCGGHLVCCYSPKAPGKGRAVGWEEEACRSGSAVGGVRQPQERGPGEEAVPEGGGAPVPPLTSQPTGFPTSLPQWEGRRGKADSQKAPHSPLCVWWMGRRWRQACLPPTPDLGW